MKFFLITLTTILLSQSVYSQKDTSNILKPVHENNIDFYSYTIDKYVCLIKNVYEGDVPFFVLVDDIYSNQEYGIFNIELTYTRFFNRLIEYKNYYYYSYNKDSTIFIIIKDHFQGDSTFKDELTSTLKCEKITEQVLQKTFYPLTDEFRWSLINASNINEFFIKQDTHIVEKFGDSFRGYINGECVVYYNNYNLKNVIIKEQK